MTNVLEIRDLRKTFGDFTLNVPSLTMPAGYIMGLIGPNGAGKTTLIKLIMNLVRKESGEVRVFGLDSFGREAGVKARIGFVPDTPRYYDFMRAKTYKSLIAPFYADWDETGFRRLADRFGLPLTRRLSAYSRGMRMKFSLALALSHQADLLLMDEPTTGLDPVFRREFLEHLGTLLQDERKSVLFSTQITSDLDRIADFVTYLQSGRVLFSCAKDEIRESWGVVKGGRDLLDPKNRPLFAAVEEGPYAVRALTFDIREARRRLPKDAVFEKPALEEVMVFLESNRSKHGG